MRSADVFKESQNTTSSASIFFVFCLRQCRGLTAGTDVCICFVRVKAAHLSAIRDDKSASNCALYVFVCVRVFVYSGSCD